MWYQTATEEIQEGLSVGKNQPQEFVKQLSVPFPTEAAFGFSYPDLPQPSL